MNLDRDADANRIIKKVGLQLRNRRQWDDNKDHDLIEYAETDLEKVVASFLDETGLGAKLELLRLVKFYIEEEFNDENR